MKYRDLIQFEPVEDIIALKHADQRDKAVELVKTFVISNDMAEKVEAVIIPNLLLDGSGNEKGLFVVGNYGSGKSHLMSLLSSCCEHKDLSNEVAHESLKMSLMPIAGQFKVLRIELDTTMPLRDAIAIEFEKYLKSLGIEFHFKRADEVTNSKYSFQEMMAEFHERFPSQGFLLVIDELLDYLAHRKEYELIQDLSFLRAMGEVCKELKFRFMAGIQEMIFDAPRFQFAAERLARVKERIDHIIIAKNDLKFVVANRLLKKSVDQEQKIKEHLQQFTSCYSNMNEKLNEYVSLFPIHPEYIDTFDRLTVIEKRVVLKTLSGSMKKLLDKTVPEDSPGIIAFDNYWRELCNNPTYKANPDIKAVLECSNDLESKVKSSFSSGPNKMYVEQATRIIHALSIHRLTLGDIFSPVGMHATELRDQLCLYDQGINELGAQDLSVELATQIAVVLKQISKAVSGSYISKNPDNEQYFLDLNKVEDYDALIEQRAETLDDNIFDRYYFDVLNRLLDKEASKSYVSGHFIWEEQIRWPQKNAWRQGYLFLGTPADRSTAKPPRDYYIYFEQLFHRRSYKDGMNGDEVFLRLTNKDKDFLNLLRFYAGARELEQHASGNKKQIYRTKADSIEPAGYLQQVLKWLRRNTLSAFSLCFQGEEKPLIEWLKQFNLQFHEEDPFLELVHELASHCFAAHFSEQAPEYPKFRDRLPKPTDQYQFVRDSLKRLNGKVSNQGSIVLEGLELFDSSEQLVVNESRYSRFILDLLNKKAQGQMLNRSEIISEVYQLEFMAPGKFRLEPDFVAVLVSALVLSGEIVLTVGGTKFDATNFDALCQINPRELVEFKHVSKQKDYPITEIKLAFSLLGIEPGQVNALVAGSDTPIQVMHTKIEDRLPRVVTLEQQFQGGFKLWGESLVGEVEIEKAVAGLKDEKEFLETMSRYKSGATMKNFKLELEGLNSLKQTLELVSRYEELWQAIAGLQQNVQYFIEAERTLPPYDSWLIEMGEIKGTLLSELRSSVSKINPENLILPLSDLKKSYIEHYAALHSKARLSKAQDDRKKRLLSTDPRVKKLDAMRPLSVVSGNELVDLKNKISPLVVCTALTKDDLESGPRCPHCSYTSSNLEQTGAEQLLDWADNQVDTLMGNWLKTIIKSIQDPSVKNGLGLLEEQQQDLIQNLLNEEDFGTELMDSQIEALKELLKGLKSEDLSLGELKSFLCSDGSALSLEDLREKFDEFLRSKYKGDLGKIRILIQD